MDLGNLSGTGARLPDPYECWPAQVFGAERLVGVGWWTMLSQTVPVMAPPKAKAGRGRLRKLQVNSMWTACGSTQATAPARF